MTAPVAKCRMPQMAAPESKRKRRPRRSMKGRMLPVVMTKIAYWMMEEVRAVLPDCFGTSALGKLTRDQDGKWKTAHHSAHIENVDEVVEHDVSTEELLPHLCNGQVSRCRGSCCYPGYSHKTHTWTDMPQTVRFHICGPNRPQMLTFLDRAAIRAASLTIVARVFSVWWCFSQEGKGGKGHN